MLKKELLNQNCNALKNLHDSLGFDFCKPYQLEKITGRFTTKQIINKVSDAKNMLIAVYVLECYGDYMDLITVDHVGNINIAIKTPYYSKRGGAKWLSTFYTKSTFENTRKNDKTGCYIIAQNKEFLKVPEKVTDKRQRFKIKDITKCGTQSGKTYISRVALIETETAGGRYDLNIIGRVFYQGANYPEKIGDVIDKSGYLVRERRADLIRRGKALKAEREKAAFMVSDYSDKIKELETLIDKKRGDLSKMILSVTDYESAGAAEKAVDSFKWTLYSFGLFKERCNNKWYAGTGAADNAYNNIKGALI